MRGRTPRPSGRRGMTPSATRPSPTRGDRGSAGPGRVRSGGRGVRLRRSPRRRARGLGPRRRRTRGRRGSGPPRRTPRARPPARPAAPSPAAPRGPPRSRRGAADIGVSIGPGVTALIRTPSRMYSSAAVRVSALTAALAAPYAAMPGIRRYGPMTELTLTITPPSGWVRIAAISCFRQRKTPCTLVSNTARQSSSGRSATGPASSMPALFTATSSLPYRSVIRPTSAATSPFRRTSATIASARPPSASIAFTVVPSVSAVRPATITVAPSRAKSWATTRPAPVPPPVTRTILSVKRVMRSPFAGRRCSRRCSG